MQWLTLTSINGRREVLVGVCEACGCSWEAGYLKPLGTQREVCPVCRKDLSDK